MSSFLTVYSIVSLDNKCWKCYFARLILAHTLDIFDMLSKYGLWYMSSVSLYSTVVAVVSL